jgi:hypothetical protein
VQHKIDFAGYYTPFAHAWSRFWDYFDHTWGDLFPPPTWSVYEIISDPKEKNKLVNMTNNALERFNRRLNECFPNAHPKMPSFVEALNEVCSEYVAELERIQKGRSNAPVHQKANIPQIPMDYF